MEQKMNLDFKILYVNDTAISSKFYAELLNIKPTECSPTFSMFPLKNEMKLGLKEVDSVEPKSEVTGGGSELCFTVASANEVDNVYKDWCERGISIAQAPTPLNYAYTFVGLDPDGHRLRVAAMN